MIHYEINISFLRLIPKAKICCPFSPKLWESIPNWAKSKHCSQFFFASFWLCLVFFHNNVLTEKTDLFKSLNLVDVDLKPRLVIKSSHYSHYILPSNLYHLKLDGPKLKNLAVLIYWAVHCKCFYMHLCVISENNFVWFLQPMWSKFYRK